MVAGISFFLQAAIPWYLIEIIFMAGLLILTVIRAIQRAEIGYQDGTGFHYGNANSDRHGSSRFAKSSRKIEVQTCVHSRSRESRKSGRRPHTSTE
jgi:hypothetical protein